MAAGGALTFLINACLTPLLPRGVSFAETVASPIFPWRAGMAAAAAASLIFSSVGLYFRQAARAGRFGAVAFVVALLGSALVLATEWVQLFNIRDLALRGQDGRGPSPWSRPMSFKPTSGSAGTGPTTL